MFVRRLAIASLVLLAACWAVPSALAQATAESNEAAVEEDAATAEALESVEEKPAPKIPKRPIAAVVPEEDVSEPVDMSFLEPQDDVQARRQAALASERHAQEKVELAKPSVRRTKVVRMDTQPKPKTRPIAIIKGTLGPYGYGQRYRDGTAGNQKNQQNQNMGPGQQSLGALGGGARGNRRESNDDN
ncbi:MAG: hypothetical protein WC655_26085 [Candidatus Hydrogenedentales bacterium]|jgi:hypothetical protein